MATVMLAVGPGSKIFLFCYCSFNYYYYYYYYLQRAIKGPINIAFYLDY